MLDKDMLRSMTRTSPQVRAALLRRAAQEIRTARQERALILAAEAVLELRELFPQGRRVLFTGPQEPGGGCRISQVLGDGGEVLFDPEEGIDPDGREDDVTPAEDFLTGAHEDGAEFDRQGPYLTLRL